MTFTTESEFEEALIQALSKKGWEKEVLKRPTEKDLLQNWANILFENNRGKDRLNDFPLTEGEMQQILEQINALRTPLKLNGFINGKTVSIKRDNPDDELHFGKEISLKIYDRHEISAGQSRYQIAQQPVFPTKSKILNDRRGDLMLLINGMPLIHIELKRSGVSVSQACYQIENYARSGVFTGLFSLVQIFVAMEPKETVYFANPGPDGKFNKDFYFHWADFNNEPINYWSDIASSLLFIPMAHQLIGFYTVADGNDGVLKVMRSYQYFAASAISDKVAKTDWKSKHALGGFIWHTTGSGKTMTSFKSAQLIANSQDADKVIFLMDRIELGTQSLKEYRGFAEENEDVQATENTGVLVTKLKSDDPANTLIVTSIQKMSNIKDEEGWLNAHDLLLINKKRIVFIVDEAHRTAMGIEMLPLVKKTFSSAIFFGFTGTPILHENQRHFNTTSTVFGDELHRYSIADGIRDQNVLGFDPYKILTYRDRDLRLAVALEKSRANDEAEALSDPRKAQVFNKYMNSVRMAGYVDASGRYIRGIEDYLPTSQYDRYEHHQKVVEDIIRNWIVLSQNGKFHAIFATSSIVDAILYYRLFKAENPDLKITALFDQHIDNNDNAEYKEDGLVEIMTDYNERYEQDFRLANHAKFKKDIAARLAHKEPYLRIETTPEKQIDLLIVVDQMLTGFDSKWINTLYMDKVLEYENIIQAFSRTNRLFGPDKPFGTIRYYRKPHTMERNINNAVKLYSGDKPIGLFVEHLDSNLNSMNHVFGEIENLFRTAGIENFERLADDLSERGRFAQQFKRFNNYLEAAKIQGFNWSKPAYSFGKGKDRITIEMALDENTYLILALRYKELFNTGGNGGGGDVPYEIEGYLTEIDTDKIDSDYMNSRFDKYIKELKKGNVDSNELQNTLDELYKSFATLTQEEQKCANLFIRDVQAGIANLESGKTFREYITEYEFNAKNDQIKKISTLLGLNESKLRLLMSSGLTEANINEYGRFDELKNTVDKIRAKEYFEKMEGKTIPAFKVNIRIHNLLQKFIIEDGFEI
ncbi:MULTISPECIES: type I restriction endonuclease subunit R [unclassified Chryseobacterium]|uniref:type I restriction endonuclease subunit R n=1 Tax=unclassified Chryseobacterium TaxID=2593645 RepID=UPI000D35C8A3|nr:MULTISPECIES: HsdR family type I site-specific deoxyribonuclease [unclassified Chryseobacterium]PTT66910.1 DEAD/DEAH box helicase [Chryseobacterium sp. HMWF001]PVV57219.1 type I restriction endonuclease subunit R [Chryseobacterium sp. HMWF035]